MVRKNKSGTYEHFCLLIFAQGKWGKLDKDMIRNQINQLRKTIKEDIYHLFLKLTYRDGIPQYSDCQLCKTIYDLFQELKSNNDGIYYQGHHWIDSDDYIEMKKLTDILLSNKSVKKIYILYLDSFHELKRTAIAKMSLNELKDLLVFTKNTKLEFGENLKDNIFNERVIYEITKDSYF